VRLCFARAPRQLAANPKTQGFLSDPAFMQKLRDMQANPALSATAFSDPRMIQVIGVLMGVDLQAFDRPEGTADKGAFDPTNPEASAPPPPPPAASSSSSSSAPPKASPPPPAPKAKAPEPEPEAEPMEVDDEASKKTEAEAVKKAGNEAYKARRFEEAIEKYEKAWELYPKDISFLTNLAGPYLRPHLSSVDAGWAAS
jgi:stress-induced-phosphoprotein 1